MILNHGRLEEDTAARTYARLPGHRGKQIYHWSSDQYQQAVRLAAAVETILTPDHNFTQGRGLSLHRFTETPHRRYGLRVYDLGATHAEQQCALAIDGHEVLVYRPGAWEAVVEAWAHEEVSDPMSEETEPLGILDYQRRVIAFLRSSSATAAHWEALGKAILYIAESDEHAMVACIDQALLSQASEAAHVGDMVRVGPWISLRSGSTTQG